MSAGNDHQSNLKKSRRRRNVSLSTIIILVLTAIAAFAYYAGTPPATPESGFTGTAPPPNAVIIVIPAGIGANPAPHYIPPAVTVVIGVNNTVSWVDNDTTATHNVISVSEPPTGQHWDFENMVYGNSYSVTLTVPGTYAYEVFLPEVVGGLITVKSQA